MVLRPIAAPDRARAESALLGLIHGGAMRVHEARGWWFRLVVTALGLGWTLASGTMAAPSWKRGPDAPAVVPPIVASSMVFDVARSRLVLHGGFEGGYGWVSDVWEHDGTMWSQGRPAPAAMGARSNAAMAYDARRARVVVFGGQEVVPLDDTWEFDGSSWVPGPAGPSARHSHAMCYDAARQRIVMFGGTDGAVRQRDVWEYDGAGWTPGTTPPAPLTARLGHMMDYDAGRARTVVFGGNDGSFRNDLWEYDGSVWMPGAVAPAGVVLGVRARSSTARPWEPSCSSVVTAAPISPTPGSTTARPGAREPRLRRA